MELYSHGNRSSDTALRLEAIIQTATDGIITIDERGIIESVNDAAAKLFGYEKTELIGENISILMPQPHRSNHDHYIRHYLETGERRIIGIGREVKGMRKDGALFPFRLSISEVNLKERRIFTGIVHDLSEQKEAEKALREEKEKARMYFDLANTLNVVLDLEGHITDINRKGSSFLGQPKRDLIGKSWFDLVLKGEDRATVRESFCRMMSGKRQLMPYMEYIVHDRDGHQRHFAWHNNLIRDREGDGLVTGLIASGIDITEQREAEKRIKNLNAELEERVETRTEELAEAVNQLLNINRQLEYEIQERKAAEEALRENEKELRKAYEKEKQLSELKSRFVSMASHEFRTPLSTILSSADLLEAYKREDQQPKREKHTGRIKSAVANLTGILNDFLSLSKLEEGKIKHQPVHFELKAFCDETLDEVHNLLKPGQQIQFAGPEKEKEVYLDKKFLKNILFNLLSNAIKYSNAEKPIDFQLQSENGELKVKIADRGIGIPEEEQQHLFTRFFRAHNVENIQGTGLGLNIVKRYVELMEGEISFDSKQDVGTTFHIRIPLNESPNAAS